MERLTKRITENQIELSAKANPTRYGNSPQRVHVKHPFWNVFDKLCEYEQLEEQGLLLKLPCKVGDSVYSVEFRDSAEIVLEKVDSFKISGNDIWVFGRYDKFIGRLGGSVFDTKEEAEAKLKELKGC